MTLEEKYSLMQEEIERMAETVDKVYYALVGNELGKDGGLVQRITQIENGMEKIDDRIKKIEADNIRSSIYIGIIGALGGALLGGIVSWVVNHI